MLSNNNQYINIINIINIYYNLYNKLPSYNDNNHISIFLRIFLEYQKEKYTNNKLTCTEYNLLLQIPTFICELNLINLNKIIDIIIDYHKKNGILPQIYSKDIETKNLAKFLIYQKQRYNELSNDEYNLLFKIPTCILFLSNDDKVFIKSLSFEEKFLYINNYYDEYDKLPPTTSNNIIVRTLGKFLSNKQYNYRNNKLSEYEYDILCQIPLIKHRFNKSNLISYKMKIKKIIEFYNINKELPKYYNSNKKNKELYIFLRYQKVKFQQNKLLHYEYNILCKYPILKLYLHNN